MEKIRNQRNETLDFLKIIAAYMVVFIHVPFYGEIGIVIKALARFAVPVFFMTSGYFCYQNDAAKIIRKTKKIVLILLGASLLYNATNLLTAYSNGGIEGMVQSLAAYKDIGNWITLFLFNKPFSATRLWFLFALIYVYILQLILTRLKVSDRVITIISASCLALNLILGELLTSLGIALPDYSIRNFLLTGYPFFGFGLLFRKWQEKTVLIKNKYIIMALICGIVLSIISVLYAPDITLCVGSVLITFALFILSLKFSNRNYPVWMTNIFSCSLGIYVFHRVLTTVCSIILRLIGLSATNALFHNLLPILVCVSTTLFVLVFNKFCTVLKRILNKPKE